MDIDYPNQCRGRHPCADVTFRLDWFSLRISRENQVHLLDPAQEFARRRRIHDPPACLCRRHDTPGWRIRGTQTVYSGSAACSSKGGGR